MNRDFEESFALLNTRSIDFLVIGGVACNFHAPPRATKDIDVWVGPQTGNLERRVEAIGDFGFPTQGLDLGELATEARVVMLGHVPNRIDLLGRPAGLVWEVAWSRRLPAHYGEAPIWVLSLEDRITAKRAAGRPRDLADASTLESIARRAQHPGD